jgi:tRNA 2-selenouridine synthase
MTTTKMRVISAKTALNCLLNEKSEYHFVDVRSEGEYAEASIPGFANIPILNNEHRHIVGLTYKNQGQDKAIKKGHELVEPHKSQLLEKWHSPKPTIVSCWRGGLRSKISCEWMAQAGQETLRVDGGYKAMRKSLLECFSPMPELIVLSGLTGTGKTELLHGLIKSPKTSGRIIDLEGLANHRGSAFGYYIDKKQPPQARFENSVALKILNSTPPFVVEDESLMIGKLVLPKGFKEKMRISPIVVLECTIEERVQRIFTEYIKQPLSLGHSLETLLAHLTEKLGCLERKLGGALTRELLESMTQAVQNDPDNVQAHFYWIQTLLERYYDKTYQYAFNKQDRKVLFKGNFSDCLAWYMNRL